MIKVTVDSTAATKLLLRLKAGLTPEALDPVVQRVMYQSLGEMVAASPKRWFGQIRSGWTVRKLEPGNYELDIPQSQVSIQGTSVAQIARFVNFGTANDGAGFIYPTRSTKLYIPLKRSAAAGWRQGLVYGLDYILRPFVRGIKGRHFIEPVRARQFQRMRLAMRKFVVDMVRGKG